MTRHLVADIVEQYVIGALDAESVRFVEGHVAECQISILGIYGGLYGAELERKVLRDALQNALEIPIGAPLGQGKMPLHVEGRQLADAGFEGVRSVRFVHTCWIRRLIRASLKLFLHGPVLSQDLIGGACRNRLRKRAVEPLPGDPRLILAESLPPAPGPPA